MRFDDCVVDAVASVKGVVLDMSVVVFLDSFSGVAVLHCVFCPSWAFPFWEACEVMCCDDPEAGWVGHG